MSRVRTRPTRDVTRQRLFEAAAKLFERRGIGAATIDAIVVDAGLTRGAFYSNFATKDDLIVAMLEDHAEKSLAHFRNLIAKHEAPKDFVSAMRLAERNPDDLLGRTPLLHIELILFVARSGANQPELAARLRARRVLVAEVVEAVYSREAVEPALAGAMLVALEDGFRLHQLIDPETTPSDSFERAAAALESLVRRAAE